MIIVSAPVQRIGFFKLGQGAWDFWDGILGLGLDNDKVIMLHLTH